MVIPNRNIKREEQSSDCRSAHFHLEFKRGNICGYTISVEIKTFRNAVARTLSSSYNSDIANDK